MLVNGIDREVKEAITLEKFLLLEGYITGRVVVELNEAIIPQTEYAAVNLTEKDRIEIIHFVGGG